MTAIVAATAAANLALIALDVATPVAATADEPARALPRRFPARPEPDTVSDAFEASDTVRPCDVLDFQCRVVNVARWRSHVGQRGRPRSRAREQTRAAMPRRTEGGYER